jgi:arginine deiminase
MSRLRVDSEIGTLRRVILHRPDLELLRLTPRNREALLFDDVLWVKRARQEHDAFADALIERGVTVHLLGDLLAETLADAGARDVVVDRTLTTAAVGPALADALREWFLASPAGELAQRLVGGVAHDELAFASRSLSALAARADGFVLDPLPNHMFTRDTSAWIFNGVSVDAMAKPARRREAVHLDAIYRHHPLFAPCGHDRWSDGLGGPAELEGGDMLVIGNRSVLIGMGERTRPAAVERLADALELPRLRIFETGADRYEAERGRGGPRCMSCPIERDSL